MAEVGDKLVNLKSLGATVEAIFSSMQDYLDQAFSPILQSMMDGILDLQQNKLNAPKVNGTIGQVLTIKDANGTTEWKDMSASISEADVCRIVEEYLANMEIGNVAVVRQSTHHTDYTMDTLEFVTDSAGKVINAYFMSK